ncbi:peroxiredoxin [Chitinophaga sp. W3I9]|uniref:TlpA family protein disulfide reductase n=1 Tax=Chitinophaga sp. W3I9 TaxID=3373924 RepID=UPI003D1F7E0C
MKHKLFPLFLPFLLVPVFLYAQDFSHPGQFVLKGKVKHYKDKVYEFGMSTFFGSFGDTIRIKADGSFEQTVPVQQRQHIYLYLDDDRPWFTVADKDTIYLQWDQKEEVSSLTIRAQNEGRTKEITQQLQLHKVLSEPFSNLNQQLSTEMKDLTAEEKFKKINLLFNSQAKSIFEVTDTFSQFSTRQISALYFEYSNLLFMQRLLPKFGLSFIADSVGNYTQKHSTIQTTHYKTLNENWFWNVPEYRTFIYNYLRMARPFNATISASIQTAPNTKSNYTMDYYHLAEANIPFTAMKDWFITNSIMSGFEYYEFNDVKKVYDAFMNTCNTPFLKDTLQQYYTTIAHLKPGSPAPDFTLTDATGKNISLKDYKGKVVYIDFWGVGCGPCIYDIQNHVPQLHKDFEHKEVVFLNICVDETEVKWKDALKKYHLEGVNLVAEGWTAHPVCKAYNVNGIPHYVLIDKTGKLSNNNAPRPSDASLKGAIENLLK